MSQDYFQFKQFRINQASAAMKVGTDGCLLGAWAPVEGVRRVLDIGTGTGLLALMCAQRLSASGSSFQVDAIDVEPQAILQAQENVETSPWKERIFLQCHDVRNFASAEKYDLIICNPPFFVNSLECSQKERTQARHCSSLPFRNLCGKAEELLDEKGVFCVVLPTAVFREFRQEALNVFLYLRRCLFIKTVERKSPKRVLALFRREEGDAVEEMLILQRGSEYTEEAKEILRDFYLNL